jgi:hypothetical protein
MNWITHLVAVRQRRRWSTASQHPAKAEGDVEMGLRGWETDSGRAAGGGRRRLLAGWIFSPFRRRSSRDGWRCAREGREVRTQKTRERGLGRCRCRCIDRQIRVFPYPLTYLTCIPNVSDFFF